MEENMSRRPSLDSIVNAVVSVGAVAAEFENLLLHTAESAKVQDDQSSIVSEIEHLHDYEEDLRDELEAVPLHNEDQHPISDKHHIDAEQTQTEQCRSRDVVEKERSTFEPSSSCPKAQHGSTRFSVFLRLAQAVFGFRKSQLDHLFDCTVQGGVSVVSVAASKFLLPVLLPLVPSLMIGVEFYLPRHIEGSKC